MHFAFIFSDVHTVSPQFFIRTSDSSKWNMYIRFSRRFWYVHLPRLGRQIYDFMCVFDTYIRTDAATEPVHATFCVFLIRTCTKKQVSQFYTMFRYVHHKRRFNGTSIEVALSSGSGQDLSQEGHSQQGGRMGSPSRYCRFACLGLVTGAEEA